MENSSFFASIIFIQLNLLSKFRIWEIEKTVKVRIGNWILQDCMKVFWGTKLSRGFLFLSSFFFFAFPSPCSINIISFLIRLKIFYFHKSSKMVQVAIRIGILKYFRPRGKTKCGVAVMKAHRARYDIDVVDAEMRISNNYYCWIMDESWRLNVIYSETG